MSLASELASCNLASVEEGRSSANALEPERVDETGPEASLFSSSTPPSSPS